MIVRFRHAVANTPRGAVRDLSTQKARTLLAIGLVERVADSPESAPAPVEPPKRIPASEIREWAAGYGLKCPERGPIPKELRQAYIAQHYTGG